MAGKDLRSSNSMMLVPRLSLLSLCVHWDASLTLVSVASCFLIDLTLEGLSKIFQQLLEQFSYCHAFILDAQC